MLIGKLIKKRSKQTTFFKPQTKTDNIDELVKGIHCDRGGR